MKIVTRFEKSVRLQMSIHSILFFSLLAVVLHLFALNQVIAAFEAKLFASIVKKAVPYVKTNEPGGLEIAIVAVDGPELAAKELESELRQLNTSVTLYKPAQLIGMLKGILIVPSTEWLSKFGAALEAQRVLVVVADREAVKRGEAVLGLTKLNSRVKIIVNLEEARRRGFEFSSEFLRICERVGQ